jgi:hypothetical protein
MTPAVKLCKATAESEHPKWRVKSREQKRWDRLDNRATNSAYFRNFF